MGIFNLVFSRCRHLGFLKSDANIIEIRIDCILIDELDDLFWLWYYHETGNCCEHLLEKGKCGEILENYWKLLWKGKR